MFKAALFTSPKSRKQPVSIDTGMDKQMCCVHTNTVGTMIHCTTWMELENIMPSKISQILYDSTYMKSLAKLMVRESRM